MNDDRLDKRRTYEAAKAYERAYYERFYPVRALGGRPAEPVTPEVLLEINRLKALSEEAGRGWEEAKRLNRPSPDGSSDPSRSQTAG